MKHLLFLLALVSPLLASDSRTAQSSQERHRQQRAYFQQEERKDWWNSPYMTGDWGTARNTLANAGITVETSFTTDMVGNPIGGQARGFAYAGSYGSSVNINCDKIGLTGFEIFSSAVWRTGTSLSQRKIGNQFPVQQVFGSQTVKLNELYLMQTLFNGNLALKAGRLDPCNDFLASPLYGQFVNNGFDGNPISIFFNFPITAYPNPIWGAYLFFKPFKRLSAKFAVYNSNTTIQKNKYHGINFTFKSTNGQIYITEWCALVNQEPGDHGLPGNYKAGYFYLTGKGDQPGKSCYYLLFDQMVYQGLTPFIALVYAPNDQNLLPFFLDTGFCFKGILPNRPDDTASFGYIYGQYQHNNHFESVIELNYWIQWSPWLSIVPDFQYIIHPKGHASIPNAVVFGVQIGVIL